MSEKTISRSKVIQIIGITWILSFITTLLLVYTVPTLFQKSWQETYRFSGSYTGEYDDYPEIFIKSDHWKLTRIITYKPLDLNNLSTCHISVFKPETRIDWSLTGNRNNETSNPIHSSGYHLLRIQGNNCDWEIIIEEYL